MKKLFSFPNPVNETSARIVAGVVVLEIAATLITRQWWIMLPLVYGFWARALTGPKLSPLAFVVTHYVTPHLHWNHKFCAGPPKRFAQSIGATLSTTALISYAFSGWSGVTLGLLGLILAAASLESIVGFCIGCHIFSILMRLGIIPDEVCERCANIWSSAPS